MQQRNSTIDLSLLALPITKKEIETYSRKNERAVFSSRWLYGAITAFLLIPIAANLPLPWMNNQLMYILIAICLAAGTVTMVINGKKNAKRRALLYRFAQQNDIIVRENTTAAGQTGMIFQYGHSQDISQMLQFPNGLEVGNYHYVTGHGKNARSHTWSFASIPLNRTMPHIVLDSKSNNIFRKFTNLPEGFDADQKLSLEGDFDSYFTLYAPQEYKKDLLYLFTPDVMAALVDHSEHYDIEIIDSTLYFYSTVRIDLNSEEALRSLIEMTETISDEIIDQNQNYRDERLANEPANVQKSTIAYEGRRLKRRVKLTAIIVWLIIFAVYAYGMTRS